MIYRSHVHVIHALIQLDNLSVTKLYKQHHGCQISIFLLSVDISPRSWPVFLDRSIYDEVHGLKTKNWQEIVLCWNDICKGLVMHMLLLLILKIYDALNKSKLRFNRSIVSLESIINTAYGKFLTPFHICLTFYFRHINMCLVIFL